MLTYGPHLLQRSDTLSTTIHIFYNLLGSASAPVFSAVIALLNDALLAQGRPVLGFLNPWLYSSGKDGLTDIVDGGSNGCGSNDTETANGPVTPLVPFASWNATPGWDPVTGLRHSQLREAVAVGLAVHRSAGIRRMNFIESPMQSCCCIVNVSKGKQDFCLFSYLSNLIFLST